MTVQEIASLTDGTNDIYLELNGQREKLNTYEESLAFLAYGKFIVSHITATKTGDIELTIKTVPAKE